MSHAIGTGGGRGLTAFQLKVIALVCMTLDHIAAFGFEIPGVARFEDPLRTIGRIAAPLFLFLLVQSVRHTRSKPRLVLRLYLAGLCVGLFDTGMNFFFGEQLGYWTPGNILFTFFYTALYIVLIERMVSAGRERDFPALLRAAGVLVLSLLPTLFFDLLYDAIPMGNTTAERFLFLGLESSLLPSFYDAEYGIGLILLGVVLYFAGTKRRQCLVFLVFCLFCTAGTFVGRWHTELYYISFYGFFPTFFDLFQCRMVLALPFMLLYNGERGRPWKWFFYGYYPLHRQLIHIIASFFA